MSRIRERISDALLRTGTQLSLDRLEFERSLAGAPTDGRGYAGAVSTLVLARWFDSMLIWLSWRLRPRTITHIAP